MCPGSIQNNSELHKQKYDSTVNLLYNVGGSSPLFSFPRRCIHVKMLWHTSDWRNLGKYSQITLIKTLKKSTKGWLFQSHASNAELERGKTGSKWFAFCIWLVKNTVRCVPSIKQKTFYSIPRQLRRSLWKTIVVAALVASCLLPIQESQNRKSALREYSIKDTLKDEGSVGWKNKSVDWSNAYACWSADKKLRLALCALLVSIISVIWWPLESFYWKFSPTRSPLSKVSLSVNVVTPQNVIIAAKCNNIRRKL